MLNDVKRSAAEAEHRKIKDARESYGLKATRSTVTTMQSKIQMALNPHEA